MAEVYKSTHPDLGRDIAVKILHPFHTQMPGFIGRFRLEAQAAASLHHPNIVQVYDFAVTDDGLYYMVMQYINGLSLEEYLTLEKSPLTLVKAFWFFRQIANALQFAHQRDTIHRDVKPANIMLDTRENAYLSDFGLAKIVGVDRQTLSGMSPGTPSYMAPEHISGKNVTAAVDIYALGVILYRMLTNRLPYEGDNLMTIITRTLTEPPTPPREYNPDIPEVVEEIILQAMSENPQERFADAATMSRALADALASGGETIPELRATPVGVIPLPGLQLDNYKVKREFIRDSAGVSRRYYQRYLAHNVALDAQAVLTVLKASADQDSHFISRFQQRMEALTLLDHPGLAAITRIDKTPSNQPYVAYEFIPGNSLETEMEGWHKEETRLPVLDALRLIRKIAEPLALVHEASLVHNDLRPENIIIRETGDPVLVGLEIPVAPDASARTDAVKALDYASPEQLEGNPIDERSNVFSLGVMLYELLAGHRPLFDWNVLDDANMPQPIPLNTAKSGLAAETYQLVADCLSRKAEERVTGVDAFIERVDKAMAAELAWQEQASQNLRQRRRLFTAVPVVALVIFLLGFIFFQGWANPLSQTDAPLPPTEQESTATITIFSPSPASPIPPSPTMNNDEESAEAINPAATATNNIVDTVSMPPSASQPAPPSLVPTLDLFKIPTITPTPSCMKPEGWITYIVKRGDVLFTLSLNSGAVVETVKQANCLDGNVLSIGQALWLPAYPATITPTPSMTPSPTHRPRRPSVTPTKTPPSVPTSTATPSE